MAKAIVSRELLEQFRIESDYVENVGPIDDDDDCDGDDTQF